MLTVIAAIDEKGGIGRGGSIPWRCPADLKRFRGLTMGRAVIVGRRTWESIPGGLPGRAVIVLSRSLPRDAGGRTFLLCPGHSLLLPAAAKAPAEVFAIGGSEVYALALPFASRILLTRVQGDWGCDAFFPKVAWAGWRLASSENFPDNPGLPHAVEEYTRVTKTP